MKNNRFSVAKNIFIEGGGVFDYVALDKSIIAYNKIVSSLEKPLKLILLYGKPGVGKTFLLQKIKKDFEKTNNIIFLSRPYFEESDFFSTIYSQIFQTNDPSVINYEIFLSKFENNFFLNPENKITTIILLDEAQLYPSSLMEKIRLMADTRNFKFLFTVHKTNEEDLLAKDHFESRIWESIELLNSSLEEMSIYLKKKFIFHEISNLYYLFSNKHLAMLYDLSKGNLRTLNKLMYKIFEIYEYLEETKPSLINNDRISTKYIEMAGIDAGLIHA